MESTRRDIPFEIRSGLRFFEQAHIKDVVAYLRVMVNPGDEISWKRILRMSPRIGKKTADNIYEYLKGNDNPVDLFINKEIGKHFKSMQQETVDKLSKLFGELEGLASLPRWAKRRRWRRSSASTSRASRHGGFGGRSTSQSFPARCASCA